MRLFRVLAAGLLALALTPPSGAAQDPDEHSPNMSLVGTFNDNGTWANGTDIAFWGNLAAFGNYNPGGFRLMDISDAKRPKLVSNFECTGSQSDVSMWEDLVFVSVDAAKQSSACDAPDATEQEFTLGLSWEGVRIVSIADPAKPVQIAAVETDCGSHTNTIVPDLEHNRLLIYVMSYPLSAYAIDCNPVSHRKVSVIEVPLNAPTKASVVSTPSTGMTIGCHDVTVFAERKLAAAACINQTQIWDISDPVNPKTVSIITNPLITIHHTTGWSWDGNTLVVDDELAGALIATGCLTGGDVPLGAIWFYDVSDAANPVEQGSFVIPRNKNSIECTAHQFNVIPMKGRNVLVSAWYDGGTTVVDFTDPANPKEVGYYLPHSGGVDGDSWSSYYYNGYIYVNNISARGMDQLQLNESFLNAAIRLPHMNPQNQERLPSSSQPAGTGGSPAPKPTPRVLGRGTTRSLPGTGVGSWLWQGLALVLAALVISTMLRRTRPSA
jgi:hypothetical protein